MALEVRTAEKKGYRTYTDAERLHGIAAVHAAGGRFKLAALETGYPENTLRRWVENVQTGGSVSRVNPELRAKVEQELDERFQKVVLRMTDHVLDAPLERTGVKDAMIAAGIAHQHLRLLRNQPTSISETRDLASFLSAAYGQPAKVVEVKTVEAQSPRTTEER